MLTLPPQSRVAWTVGVTFLHALAISSTIYRLAHRFRTRRTWWDDYIITVPLIFDTVLCITFWFRNPKSYAKGQSLEIQVLNSYWLTGFVFITIIWSTRTVLALSLVRIFTIGRVRRWTIALSVTMGVAWISSIIMTIATCKQTNGFLRVNAKTDCITANGVPIRSIYLATLDFSGDCLLVIAPLILFWRVNLPRAERRLILTVFCCSILTMLAVTVYIAITLNPHVSLGRDAATIGAGLSHIESSISLLVCNLAVITTCLYRFIRDKRNPSTIRDPTPLASNSCSCTDNSRTRTTLSLTEISEFSVLPETSPGARNTDVSHEMPTLDSGRLLTTFEVTR